MVKSVPGEPEPAGSLDHLPRCSASCAKRPSASELAGLRRRWSWAWSSSLAVALGLFSMSGAYSEPDRRNGRGRIGLQRRQAGPEGTAASQHVQSLWSVGRYLTDGLAGISTSLSSRAKRMGQENRRNPESCSGVRVSGETSQIRRVRSSWAVAM